MVPIGWLAAKAGRCTSALVSMPRHSVMSSEGSPDESLLEVQPSVPIQAHYEDDCVKDPAFAATRTPSLVQLTSLSHYGMRLKNSNEPNV